MAIQNEPTRIQIPFADSGTKNVIPDTNSTPSASQAASWTDGFPAQCSLPLSAGGIPPARADFNGLFNTMTQSERFTQEGGVWVWDSTVDYAANRIVLGSDSKLYWSIAQSGPNVGGAQNPITDNGTYWQAMPMNDANVVHKTGDEEISGAKHFLGHLYQRITALPNGYTANGNNINGYLSFQGVGNDSSSIIAHLQMHNANTWRTIRFMLRRYGDSSTPDTDLDSCGFACGDSAPYYSWRPFQAGTSLGINQAAGKWAEIWCAQNSINSASDERQKQSIQPLPDEVLDAWEDVQWSQFQWNDAVEEKGGAENARLHSGLIAQRVAQIFAAHGVDVSRYGLYLYDQWDGDEETPAGDAYGLRYVECLCIEAAYQRRRADRAEARIAALEERLAAIEAKLNA